MSEIDEKEIQINERMDSHKHREEHEHEHDHRHKHEHDHEHEHEHNHGHDHGPLERKDIVSLIIGAVLFAVIFIADKLGMLAPVEGTIWMLLIYLVPYLTVGYETIIEAVEKLFHGEVFDEDFLMLTASIAAFAIGEYEEAVAVMLFFKVGEMFESYALGKSRASIRDLMDIAPEFANIMNPDGSTRRVAPAAVATGSVIVIRPGERVPIDSEVLEGDSYVNTAALTGESVPRHISEGDTLFSGSVNGEGLLKCRTLKEYQDSMVSRILELTENAVSRKSKTESFITRFARVYTPAVTLAAILLAVVPGAITGDWSEWIRRACTFLVISCPCALVISVPLGFFGGIGAASGMGVLVKGSNYLEAAAKLGTVVFDKTGTLTKGEFAVSELRSVNCTEDELLALAAAVEEGSSHPIAMSICAEYEKRKSSDAGLSCADLREIPGHGLSAEIDGATVLVGNSRLMEQNNIEFEKADAYGTIIYVARDGACKGAIIISDGIKEGVKEALDGIRQIGVNRLVMLTGDLQGTAETVADRVGVDEFYAELLPGDKVRKVEELLGELEGTGHTLAFVGDGINDAPVLARADVGIAMGSLGSDSAIEAADIVIMDDNLGKLPGLARIASGTLRIVKQNIATALGVKAAVLILGAVGIASMWMAVFADVGVAMLCILNSMRALNNK